MPETLPLGLDELLTTTRSVRRRLDFSKPIAREVIEQCIEIAMQAPTPSNLQNWHLVVFPLIIMAVTLFIITLIGEGIRAAFDPKVHSRLR